MNNQEEKNKMPLFLTIFRIGLNVISCIVLLLFFIYVFYTGYVYNFLIDYTGNLTDEIVILSTIPYYLILINFALIIIYTFLKMVIARKLNFSIPQIGIVILLVSISIFTAPFDYLYTEVGNGEYPESIRYDKLFVCNRVYSNEGDYQGGIGEIKYIYLPISKKIIYFENGSSKIVKVKELKNNRIEIDDVKYTIENGYFCES
ncbi:MAG: hypothetical protein IJ193_04070 [Bacilli bacterium]|nr:hypothetical protein [Bacilli bacterium]